MKKIKILIVDDHRIIREGLVALLNQNKGSQFSFLIEEAQNGEEAIEKVKKSDYDIVLMDYRMPNLDGAETTRIITVAKPHIRVIALTNYHEMRMIKNMLKAGARGYLLKNIESDELIKAITTVLNGEKYFSNEVAMQLIDAKNDSANTKKICLEKKLCEKEIAILKLIAHAYTSRQIADKLCLSKHSIDKYRQQLLGKMQVKNSIGLIARARELTLVD